MSREQVATDAVRARLLRALHQHPGAQPQPKPMRFREVISAEYLQGTVFYTTDQRTNEPTTSSVRLAVIFHSSEGGHRWLQFVDCPDDFNLSPLKQGRFYSFPVEVIVFENPKCHRVSLAGIPSPSGSPYCQPTWLR